MIGTQLPPYWYYKGRWVPVCLVFLFPVYHTPYSICNIVVMGRDPFDTIGGMGEQEDNHGQGYLGDPSSPPTLRVTDILAHGMHTVWYRRYGVSI